MDKVIDGVDVSECKHFYSDEMCDSEQTLSCVCVKNKECDYKQLKRAKAEYDDLHLTYAGCKTANNGLQELNRKLEQENERLKEENEELCDRMAKVTYRATGGRLSYSNYTLDAIEQAFYDQLEILSDQKSEIYKQALQEIRDIAKEWLNNDWSCFHCRSNMDDKLQDILAKINEVIGAE